METTKKITKTEAKKVLAALRKQCAGWLGHGAEEPQLVMDYDTGYGLNPAIVWEGGPYQWTYTFPYGGIDEEFGARLADVSDQLPADVWVEAQNHFAVNIYRKD